MKCFSIFTAAALAASATPAFAVSYPDAVQAANPAAYFRLTQPNEPATNGTPTSWTGSVATGAGAPLASDPANTGAVFDSVNSANPGIVTTGLSGQVPGMGTILAWVNLAALPSAADHILYVAGESQGGNDFDLQFQQDNTLRFYTGGGENTSYSPDIANLAGIWHMIAATYDATLGADSFRDIYWDGAIGSSYVGGVNGAAKVNPFTIGYSPVFGGREFNGGIDEVAVYDHALTSGQIASIYASRLEAGAAGAVPEPATWAMMVGGFGIAGSAMRRGRRATRLPLTA